MIPQSEVVGIDLTDDWDRIITPIRSSGYTRLPVYREAIDNVVVPREFAEKVMPLLVPGAVLVSTESRILPESTGRRQTIIDSNPPDAPAR